MAEELQPLMAEWLGAEEEAEDARGQDMSLNETEDLLETVKRLQKEGSLEPQIEDLIHRINKLQQVPARKRSSEELGEAQALQEAMRQELDSLNKEKAHIEDVLCKKQEALLILNKYCQEKGSELRCLDPKEQLEEWLKNLTSQHKDLWEFHVLQKRLALEISVLELSEEQLLMEKTLLHARLQKVEQRLHMARESTQSSPENCGQETELKEFEGQSQIIQEAQNYRGEVGTQ